MTIIDKINFATQEIDTKLAMIDCAPKTLEFIHAIKKSLFDKILNIAGLTEQQKEEEIDIVTMGIYAYAIMSLINSCEQECIDDLRYIYAPVADGSVEVQTLNNLYVLSLGVAILKKRRLMDELQYLALIDFLNIFDDISQRINKSPKHYYTSFLYLDEVCLDVFIIDEIFKHSIEVANSNTTLYKSIFINGLQELQKETMAKYSIDTKHYGYLALYVRDLAEKVGANKVTQDDLDVFINQTQPYRTSYAVSIIIAAIIGAVIGMIAGAAIGFAIGSVPGAIIGGGVSYVSSSMWYTNKEPLNKISAAVATEIVSTQDSV